jgi:hypothetical protein
MATTDFTWGRIPHLGAEPPYLNTDSNDFAAGNVLTLDTTNVLSGTQGGFGMLLATTDNIPAGVAIEACAHVAAAPFNQSRMQTAGIVQCVASAAISAGAVLKCSTVGKVVTGADTKPQVGYAWTPTSADTDKLIVSLAFGNNGG